MESDVQVQIRQIFAAADPSRIRLAALGRDPAIVVRWVSITEFGKSSMRLGISDTGRWVGYCGDITEYIPGQYLVSLLPCLETAKPVFFEHLTRAVAEQGFPAELVRTFPAESLIHTGLRAAFQTASPYWPTLGLDWLSHSVAISGQTRQLLRDIGMAGKGVPQAVRHRAFRLSNLPAP